MKKITTLIILLLCAVSLFAQAPEKFSYQAVVRNASNALVSDAQVGVRVSILQGSANGNAVYVETHSATTNANGLLTVEIGGGSVQQGSFADIDWANGPYFLKTETDPNGGNSYMVTSTQQLLSVPYALYAKEAGNGFSGDYNDLTNLPQIPQIPADISAFNNDAGYITGYTETDPQFNAWDKDYNDLINKPEIPVIPNNVSTFINDAGYITMDSVPTVPTNVSAFTNDAGYLTGYTETDPQFNAWDKDYNDLINKPEIPIIPNNVSTFINDAGYITMDSVPTVPTNVSAFTNDAGYLTGYTETDPQFNAWDKDYNDLINKPEIPVIPNNVSTFINDAGYITMDSVPAIPTNVSAFTNDAGYITMDSIPVIPTIPTNVSVFENDAHYITDVQLQQIMNTIASMQSTIDSMGLAMEALYNQINQSDSIPAGIDTGLHVTFTTIITGDTLTIHDAKLATSDQSSINDVDHPSPYSVPHHTVGIEGYWVIFSNNYDYFNPTTFIDVNKNVTVTDVKAWGVGVWYAIPMTWMTPTSGTSFNFAFYEGVVAMPGTNFIAIKFEVVE